MTQPNALPSLTESFDELHRLGHDHAVPEAVVGEAAGHLARRVLAVAALGEEQLDADKLAAISANVPRPRRAWQQTVLARSVLAVADGAIVSPYVRPDVPAEHESRKPRRQYFDPEQLGRRIVSADLLPAVTVPEDEEGFPVLIGYNTSFEWDLADGKSLGFGYNHTSRPDTTLLSTNLRLLSRGDRLTFPELVDRFGYAIQETNGARAVLSRVLNVMAGKTPFVEQAPRGILPVVSQSAVFVDLREPME